MIQKLHQLLEIPFIYKLSQIILCPGADHFRNPIYKKIFNRPTQRVLDVGCGPSIHTPVPEGLLVGVDVNESNLRKYTGGFLDTDPALVFNPPRKRLGYLITSGKLPFADASFDEIRAASVFHHLSDSQAGEVLHEMNRCLGPGGRLMILDNVWPQNPWTRPFAWLCLRLDRGTHVRHQEQLLKLLQDSCPGRWEWERHTLNYYGVDYIYIQFLKN